MLLGPLCTATGEPGALVNNGCCDAFEGALPEGQETNEVENAATNKVNRATIAGILITEVNATLLSVSGFKTLRRCSFFQFICVHK